MTTNYYDPNTLIFIQSRAESDPALVEEYARMMAEGVGFDPASAVTDGTQIFVWDGYHRGAAAKQSGKLLFVSVRPGSREEAEWLALSANQKHGLRRSNADKRRVVELALQHPTGAQMSDRQIGAHCGVSNTFVGKVRSELSVTVNGLQSETRIGADGRVINTANIGGVRYVEMWQLERGLRAWLDKTYIHGLQTQIDMLETIKQGSPNGLETLGTLLTQEILPGPRRKVDVIQACHNVLEQLRQQAMMVNEEEKISLILAEAQANGVNIEGLFFCPNCTNWDVAVFKKPFQIFCSYCSRRYKTSAEVEALLDYQAEAMARLKQMAAELAERRALASLPSTGEEVKALGQELPTDAFKIPTIGDSFTPLTDWKCHNCGRRIPAGTAATVVKVNSQDWQICPACLPDFKKRAGVRGAGGQGDKATRWQGDKVNLSHSVTVSPPHLVTFICPRCGGRTGRVNGGALCLSEACGASWPTRAEYESELDAYLDDLDAPPLEVEPERAEALRRINMLLARLPTGRLGEVAVKLQALLKDFEGDS
jgi:hypothetical protein